MFSFIQKLVYGIPVEETNNNNTETNNNNTEVFKTSCDNNFEFVGDYEILSNGPSNNIQNNQITIKMSYCSPTEWGTHMVHKCETHRYGDYDFRPNECAKANCKMESYPTIFETLPKVSLQPVENSKVLVYSDFSYVGNIEDVSSISLIIGDKQIEIVYTDLFDTLYKLYNIPSKNENGNTIIPFSLTKGIPKLDYHDSQFVITFKEKTASSRIEYKVQYSKNSINEMNIYQVQKCYNNKINDECYKLYINGEILYFFVEHEVNQVDNELKFKFNGKESLSLQKSNTSDKYDCYREENNINFNKIDNVTVNKCICYCINKNKIIYINGMAGLMYNY